MQGKTRRERNDADDNVIPLRADQAGPDLQPPFNQIDDEARLWIEQLRELAVGYLVQSRKDWDHTCRLISVEREATRQRFAFTLFGALTEYGTHRCTFYQPGSADVSDSEAWLARALRAFSEADTAAGRALIAWRVRPIGHRRVRFLISGLADAFATASK